jgi:hypothetical protein
MTRDPYPFSVISVNQKDEPDSGVHTSSAGCVDLISVFILEQCLHCLSIQRRGWLSWTKIPSRPV